MTITLTDVEGELHESAAIVRAAMNALPAPSGDELTDTVSLLCAVEKKLELLVEAVQVIGAKQRGTK